MISRKWLVSLIYEERDLTVDWRWVSVYAETCLVDEEKEATMGQLRLPGLWSLGRK
jgi:hypothetical protein